MGLRDDAAGLGRLAGRGDGQPPLVEVTNPLVGRGSAGTDHVDAYSEDNGSIARARSGASASGSARKTDSLTMCPSYMVTREEKHSTRGRAHLPFEMLQGDVVTGGWRSKKVHDAVDLCLACKGCLNECPVNVDMATYQAELWSQHHRRRLRPCVHYAMGLLPLWTPALARLPRLVNLLTQAPGMRTIASRAAGNPRTPHPGLRPDAPAAKTPRSWRMASAAVSRSATGPAARRFTSPRRSPAG